MPYKFFPISESDKEILQNTMFDKLPKGYQNLSFCKILEAKPNFYPGWICLQIQTEQDITNPPITLFKKDDDIIILDWQVSTLLNFNKKAPLKLSINDITSYVQFFFSNVRVKDGGMKLVKSYDDLTWREEPTGRIKKTLSSLIRSPHLISWDEENHAYELGAHLLFQNNLFESRLLVSREGQINVTERVLQVEDMAVTDDSFE